jgi:hypothetical protein
MAKATTRKAKKSSPGRPARAKPKAAPRKARPAVPVDAAMAPVRSSPATYGGMPVESSVKDYLVVYEEPDQDGLPTEDGLLLDIDAGQPVSLGELDVEQKLDLELANQTNWVGRLGFVLSVIGALIGFGVLAYIGTTYPDEWYDEGILDTSKMAQTAPAAVLALLCLLIGVIMTHYGRRIQARGNLSRIRIVEKAFQPRVAVGEEA